jgi:NADH-quinone oxidoreductase subunit I
MAAHGVIGLIESKCTSCMICVEECPTWCITVDHHVEEVSEPGARRPRKVSVLDAFSIDYGLCMYCGICVDLCPFDALEWRDTMDYATHQRTGLVQGITELGSWISGS